MSVALLLIDAQTGFFDGCYLGHEVLDRIKALVEQARTNDVTVIYVKHNTDPQIDGPIHPEIAPQADDAVVLKNTPDSFFQTSLAQELESRGVTKLILAGFQTELCIDTTCRRAWSMGYEVVLVKDAHSTFSFDDAVLSAHQIIEHHTDVLGSFAEIKSTSEIEFSGA